MPNKIPGKGGKVRDSSVSRSGTILRSSPHKKEALLAGVASGEIITKDNIVHQQEEVVDQHEAAGRLEASRRHGPLKHLRPNSRKDEGSEYPNQNMGPGNHPRHRSTRAGVLGVVARPAAQSPLKKDLNALAPSKRQSSMGLKEGVGFNRSRVSRSRGNQQQPRAGGLNANKSSGTMALAHNASQALINGEQSRLAEQN